MTKEEILKEFRECVPNVNTSSEQWFASLLDKYAISLVEASVPQEEPEVSDGMGNPIGKGHNLCRSQTLENARRIVGGAKTTH
jgi:hypothetical protein